MIEEIDAKQGIRESIDGCLVCGASGAGRHYGSVCCSGCKGFFRRSVRFQKLYHCPYERNSYRNCCRACRYQKCLLIGLDPNLVHGDWGQTGGASLQQGGTMPQAASSSTAGTSNQSSSTCSSSTSTTSPPSDTQSLASSSNGANEDAKNWFLPTTKEIQSLLQHNQMLNSEEQQQMALGYKSRLKPVPGSDNDCFSLSAYFVTVERLCDLFVDSGHVTASMPGTHPKDRLPEVNLEVPIQLALKEPGKIAPRFPIGWTPGHRMVTTMFTRVYCRVMVHYFDWVSHVPELAELSEEDRQILVVKRAFRCIWLLCAFRSALLNCEGIATSCECLFPYGRDEQEKLEPEFKELFTDSVNLAFNEMVLPFRQLRVSEAEYALLRVLCLFTPVCRLSEQGRQRVLGLQAKYLNALSDLVQRQNETGGSSSMLRMSRLIMFLASAEQVAQLDDNAFSMLNVFNLAGMRGILTYEMHVRSQEELGHATPTGHQLFDQNNRQFQNREGRN